MTPTALRNDAIATAKNITANPGSYVILDTETTGLGKTAEALELAIYSPDGESLFSRYFTPKGSISPYSIDTHGLTEDVLKAKGAKPYAECHEEVEAILRGKTVVAYQASYDLGVLDFTAGLHGLDTPVTGDSLCAYALNRRYDPTLKSYKLGGDHTAAGDCKVLVELLQSMAASEQTEDPDAVVITDQSEMIQAYLQAKEIGAQRIALAKQEEALKSQVSEYMQANKLGSVLLGNGKKVVLKNGFKKIAAIDGIESLPSHYTQLGFNRKALNAEFKAKGELDPKLFTFERTYGVSDKKI